MGRLHGRACVLYLRDKDGRELEVPVGDWTIDWKGYPSVPVMRFELAGPPAEVPDGTEA